MPWLFPSTIFFLALTVWILSIIFAPKEFLVAISIGCGIIMLIGCGMMWQQDYKNAAGIFIVIMVFFAIVYFCSYIWQVFEDNTESSSNESGLKQFIGKKAIAYTCLEPKGQVQIGEQIIVATTEGLFVPQGTEVKIIRAGKDIVIVESIEKKYE